MATTTTGHPGRTLIVLAVLIAGLFALIAAGNTWAPKLGLDLRGGTTITLTAENTSGTGAIDPNSLELARTIIQQPGGQPGRRRVEVTTAGDRQLIVTVPNVQRDQLVELVGQTALLRFRAVYAAEQVTPPPAPEPTPQPTESTAPSTEPSASASVVPEPTAHGQQQADARAAHRSPEAGRRGLHVRRRAGHPARPGDRLGTQRTLPGGVRGVHLWDAGGRRRRRAAVRLRRGRDREVPAQPDPDRG